MASFLTGLSSSLGVSAPMAPGSQGVGGALGNLFGNMTGFGGGNSPNGAGNSSGGAGMPALPNFSGTAGTTEYTDPFKPVNGQSNVAPASNAQTTGQPGTNMAQQTATNWADNYILPSYGTPVNTGSASGSVYR